MLNRKEEYIKMHNIETKLWWYKILYDLVFNNLKSFDKNVNILDAGCGTGGLIEFLYKKGFKNLTGFDVSDDAINFAKQKATIVSNGGGYIDIFQYNLLDKMNFKNTFDIIISNDTFYFFTFEEKKEILKNFYKILNKDGLVILNLPALNSFSGVHNEAVGIKNRYSKRDLNLFIDESYFYLKNVQFWPILLSPIIFFMRFIQRLKMKKSDYKIVSDLNLPPKLINSLLYYLTKFEISLNLRIPFASSMFIVLKVKK